MGHIKKWWKTPLGKIVEEYHSGAKPPPGGRASKRTPTPEEMEKANQRQKHRKAQLLLMNNFRADDYFITLTYREDERPADLQECKRQFRNFVNRMKREYDRQGMELKWMRNIEVGSRGAWHIHLVVNRIPDTDILIRKHWPYGHPKNVLMYEDGGFRKLAGYLTKASGGLPKKERGSCYSHSRNLIMPKEHKREVKGNVIRRSDGTFTQIRIPKGYYLDKESLFEGVNAYTGYPYRYYVLLRQRGGKAP